MRVLITGSFRQHNDETFDDAMNSAELVSGICPTSIITGCWVGVDLMARNYAKKNKIQFEQLDFKIDTPLVAILRNVDAVIVISCFGEFDDSERFIKAAEKQNIQVAVW